MADNYYGTVAILAWLFNHYFYNNQHYTWLAEEYYPYRLPNPKSSNPHLSYQDLYQPWKDRDDYDKFIQQIRLNIRKGVIAKEKAGVLSSADATRLKDICDKVDIVFLYPIVYRVDIDNIDTTRRTIAGSGLTASSAEILVDDLGENEFEILFLDFDSDPDFKTIVVDEIASPSVTSLDAMDTLEKRC